MKLFLLPSFIILIVDATFVEGGEFEEGRKEGTALTKRVWEDDFDGNCADVYDLRKAVKREVKRLYKSSRSDNWKDEAFKKGVKKGAKDAAKDIEEECLTPIFCDDMGVTAAEMIAGDYCDLEVYRKRETPKNVCREDSIDTCKGHIQDEVGKLADDCPIIDNDIDNFDHYEKGKLKKKCEETINAWTKKQTAASKRKKDKERSSGRGLRVE
jgi:hypothetical protein